MTISLMCFGVRGDDLIVGVGRDDNLARWIERAPVARTLGVHENTVRRWEERGLLRAVRLPSGVRRFRPEDVEAMRAEMYSGFAPLREDDDVVPVTRIRSVD